MEALTYALERGARSVQLARLDLEDATRHLDSCAAAADEIPEGTGQPMRSSEEVQAEITKLTDLIDAQTAKMSAAAKERSRLYGRRSTLREVLTLGPHGGCR